LEVRCNVVSGCKADSASAYRMRAGLIIANREIFLADGKICPTEGQSVQRAAYNWPSSRNHCRLYGIETNLRIFMQTLLQFLRSYPHGGALSKNDWGSNDFLGVAAKIYKPHSVICRQDDDDDRMFIIKSGWGLLYRGLPSGDRQIIDTPLCGDIVGFRSLGEPRFASLASITELAVYEISRKELVEAVSSEGLGNKIACSLARLNAILAEHLVNVGRRNAMSRAAHFLLELEERLSVVGLSAHGKYECPLTQHELADILGLTTVHVNRTLGELRKANLISFKAGQVKVINRKNLVKTAGFDNEYLR
jgi:CRP-like cAMP-binding protein